MKFIPAKSTVAAVAAGLLLAGAAGAQEKFPSRPIRVLVPFSPGSSTDIVARMISSKMTESWGQPVVVENRPGAGGRLASEMVLRAAPDGYTLMIVANGHTANVSLYKDLPYNTLKDFAGVTFLVNFPSVLTAAAGSEFKSVRELVAYAKANPGKANYGSSGMASGSHIAGEMFNSAAGVNVVHVPFKGPAEALTATLGGSVHYSFNSIPAVLSLLKGGKVVGLAVSTDTRSPVLPDMPTLAESGVPGFSFSTWHGFVAHGKTPAAIKSQLAQESARILALPDVRERLVAMGATPKATSPEEFDAFLAEDTVRTAKVIKDAGISVAQ